MMLRQTAQNLGVRLTGAQRALPGSWAAELVVRGRVVELAPLRWRPVAARSRLGGGLPPAWAVGAQAVHLGRSVNPDLAENRLRKAGVLGLTRRRQAAVAAPLLLPGRREHAAVCAENVKVEALQQKKPVSCMIAAALGAAQACWCRRTGLQTLPALVVAVCI